MNIYLAGPMSGIPEHNYPAFHAATSHLRSMGHQVTNPAEVNPDSQILGATATPKDLWCYCMRRDIPHLLLCNTIVLLPGWMNSRGARLEVIIAIALGMTLIDYASWKALSPWRVGMQLALRTVLASPPDRDIVVSLVDAAAGKKAA